MAFPTAWPPRPASGRRSIRYYKTGTATANFSDNAFLFTDVNQAFTFIGSGDNGTVITTADTPGLDGNKFTIQVVMPTTGGPLALSATLTGFDILVRLAIDGSNNPVPASNTATLVAAAITALAGVTATATGTGASSLTKSEPKKSFYFGGAMPVIPTPYITWGAASTPVVTGDYRITSSPQGGGEIPQDIIPPEAMHWSQYIRVTNLTAGQVLEISFDGINVQGAVSASSEVIYYKRYEAGIAVRNAGGALFRIEAW